MGQDQKLESTPSTPKRTTNGTGRRQSSEVVTPSPKKRKKVEKPQREAPKEDWESIYSLVEELRSDRTAPCDHSGAEALALDAKPGTAEYRWRVLFALMLSSQTKDAVVAATLKTMNAEGDLDMKSIQGLSDNELNTYLQKVGFHNNKTKYVRETVNRLLADYNGDIPPTADEMMELPGVGPKMAYICEVVAWKRASGIGVDTHMHRLFNKLGWVNSKTPEQSRKQLQNWLPQTYWMDVNLLWVGFGQEVQQFAPKVLRKAIDCSRPDDALRLLKRCGMDVRKEAAKAEMLEELENRKYIE